MRTTKPAIERLLAKTEREGDCLLFTGCVGCCSCGLAANEGFTRE